MNKPAELVLSVDPEHVFVTTLLELYRYEHIGMYGQPDPNPRGDVDKAYGLLGATLVIVRGQTGFEQSVAMCAITLDGPNGDAVLRRMFTRWEFRREGMGRVLLRAAAGAARDLKASRLLLETGVQALPALGLYYSDGFHPVDPFGFYAEAEGSVFLGKDL